ncbi:helix-turn-helix domain-containing protein [Aneurinibacillus sp. BA2021]|nr:helix-turn-helix domain-containing protein [Aneurinibacillus sp. BA2021]
MVVNKAYKYRIYPTKEQEVLLAKTIGCSRFVFNHFLAKCPGINSERCLNIKQSGMGVLSLP